MTNNKVSLVAKHEEIANKKKEAQKILDEMTTEEIFRIILILENQKRIALLKKSSYPVGFVSRRVKELDEDIKAIKSKSTDELLYLIIIRRKSNLYYRHMKKGTN